MAKKGRAADPMIHAARADEFLSALGHDHDTPKIRWNDGEFWVWKEPSGPWVPHDEKWMQSAILRWLMETRKTSVNDAAVAVTNVIRAKTTPEGVTTLQTWVPQTLLGNSWIILKNHALDPVRVGLGDPAGIRPIESRWFTASKLSVEWEPEATCPKWLAFLDEVFDGCEDSKKLLQEWFGYCLTPLTNLHAALFVVGPSGSGKSTIASVLRRFLGPANVCSLPLEQWDREFSLRETQQKLLNLCDETSRRITRQAEAILKWYLSGAEITTNVKHARYMVLKPTARLVVCTNHWPDFHDSSDGIWRRIHALRMRKVCPLEERIPDLDQTFDPEFSGILNWAIEGLKRLRENARFTETQEGGAEVATQKAETQTARTWAQERVRPDPSGFLGATVIRPDYEEWCASSGVGASASDKELRTAVMEVAPQATYGRVRVRVNGVRPYGFRGVSLGVIDPPGDDE